MGKDIDRILKQALAPEGGPKAQLNQSILKQAEEMTYMKRGKKKYHEITGLCGAARDGDEY